MAEVEDTQEKFDICMQNCGTCPSYPAVEGEALYCARGASDQEVEREGCNCPDCPVWAEYGLTKTYYCIAKK